ncbi:spore photoproduct lyase [Calderihabitans maritimus]|uniref:Spore photoproduct lyase n=1 Tax=Calderihabitans maritimus TaxID=1246530 RepID=A0A1Z5HUV1_9FIRM|nr:spore photoproduct lyase [Calderihabitans maritimus]GAW93313.1 spore photoproduct lyase [Calderihabitans maritimus]
MLYFVPKLVLMNRQALEYPMGSRLMKCLQKEGIQIRLFDKKVPVISRGSFTKDFFFAKQTMVVTVWRRREFQTCRPSAHYQLPLVSGCPGICEYCYLNTNLGRRPFIKVYVNLEEIFARAEQYIKERKPELTLFEGAATSDPVAVERWTGSLQKAIEYFARFEEARFRFVTKFIDIDSLLGVEHKGHTEIRFSINCDYVVERFEKLVPSNRERLEAARKVMEAGYPTGFLIGPIMIFDRWREEYGKLFEMLKEYMPRDTSLTFELITHRFTPRAKTIIRQVYPRTEVPLDESKRKFKFGQFGYGKYIYMDDDMTELKDYFSSQITRVFPKAKILYFV